MNAWRLSELRQLVVEKINARSGPSVADETLPVFDLLRERREEIGQRTIASVLHERRGLLIQGLTVGAVMLGVVLGMNALVFLRHQVVKTQMGQLNEVDAQAATLRQQLERRNRQMATITEVNKQLSGALSNVRPTSALLAELQLRTPDGVQLLSADAADANLTLKGVASDPLAFARINAMQLEMRRSPLFDPLSVTLSRLERKGDTTTPAANAPTSRVAPVQFEISARFAQLNASQLEKVLRQLGSDGMARRLGLLQREGMLP